MNNLSPTLERVVRRLIAQPETLGMSQFSTLSGTRTSKSKSACGTTFCLAGIILDEAGICLEYGPDGVAVGLEEGETPPAAEWLTFEASLTQVAFHVGALTIAAKAREVWAAEYGKEAAKRLPFYGPDFEVESSQLGQVGPQLVIKCVRFINAIFATRTLQ